MKIFSGQQLREADQVTLEKNQMTSEDLMERAAGLVYEEIHKRLGGAPVPVKIFCGVGNNGGDGLVIGRRLLEQGYHVTIYIVNYSDRRSGEFLANYDRIKNMTRKWPVLMNSKEDFPEISKGDFIVDAIFGIGLNRPLVAWVGQLIAYINDSGAFVLAVDMPSGLLAEGPIHNRRHIIRASYTITFQAPKLVFYLPETAEFRGDLQILDIGLDQEFLRSTPTKNILIGKREAKVLYRPRNKFSHKGTYGHALLVGGSYGKIGSISLASTASLRTGAGMLSVFVPGCGYQILQTLLPEAMVLTDADKDQITEVLYEIDPAVIGFGVGVGTGEKTTKAFEKLLKKNKKSLVVDADGLNILSRNKHLFELLPEGSILTPHPGELQRMIGKWKDDFEKLEKVEELARKYSLIIVIKGAYTFIVTPDIRYINTSGNPGMATAGSGDVLTGVITGLVAQGYQPLSAAVLGVFLHGRAGDLVAEEKSFEGMIAGDITEAVGAAILDLFNSQNMELTNQKKNSDE